MAEESKSEPPPGERMTVKELEKVIRRTKEQEEKAAEVWRLYHEELQRLYGHNPEMMEVLNYGEDLDDDGAVAMRVGAQLIGGEILKSWAKEIIHDKAAEKKAEVAEILAEAGVTRGHPALGSPTPACA